MNVNCKTYRKRLIYYVELFSVSNVYLYCIYCLFGSRTMRYSCESLFTRQQAAFCNHPSSVPSRKCGIPRRDVAAVAEKFGHARKAEALRRLWLGGVSADRADKCTNTYGKEEAEEKKMKKQKNQQKTQRVKMIQSARKQTRITVFSIMCVRFVSWYFYIRVNNACRN